MALRRIYAGKKIKLVVILTARFHGNEATMVGSAALEFYKGLDIVHSYKFHLSMKGADWGDNYSISDFEKAGEEFGKVLSNYLAKKYWVSFG